MPPHHHVTALFSHLPCSCHQASHSFALPPATKPVSYLPCPLPVSLHHCTITSLHHGITVSPRHRVTAPLHHCINASLCHCITTLLSHLPCPLPPSQSVICLVPYHCVTASLCHHVTASLHHHATTSLCHHISQSFALPPAYKPVSHLPCPCHQTSQAFALHPTTVSPCRRITVSPRHRVTTSLHHLVSQSFALPPATKPISHLPCPLPPSQSVICLAPCHQTSQSFALPPTKASPHHHITALISQSFALPPATRPVSHLPCPLPRHHRITTSLH